jgi:prepilin-type N-terminal cleavage/methylation domain-containing protein
MNRLGFTLIELIVVIGILTGLLTIAGLNLTFSFQQSQLNSTVTSLAADIRQQQLKSMLGDTEGRASADTYGVYFGNNYYVLFHGSTYVPASIDNFTINLSTGLSFSNITLPNSVLIFSRGGGEVVGYTPGSNTFMLSYSQDSHTKTFTFNRYGTITQIN